MRGVILEGVTAAGKSTVLRHLQRRMSETYPANTKVMLSEHLTERVLEKRRHAGRLREAEVFEHLERTIEPLLALRSCKAGTWLDGRGQNTVVLVLVERFLLGHIANLRSGRTGVFSALETWEERVEALYARADECGLTRVVLTVEPDHLAARIDATVDGRNAAWRNYLRSIGDARQIHEHFVRWQDDLVATAEAYRDAVRPVYVPAGSDYDRLQTVADEIFERFLRPGSSAAAKPSTGDDS